MNEQKLAEEIVKYCKKTGVRADYNIHIGDKLVSFDVIDAPKTCEKCGQVIV